MSDDREKVVAALPREVRRLSQSDVNEVVKFQEHLADMATMPRDEFYRKYQEYMGLSDAELSTILAGVRDGKE